jgi:hypothetical protein
VSDRTRLQKLFISVNTPFTRGFSAKIPVYEECAAGAILGDFGQLWATLGFSGNAVYKGFFALKYSFTVTISCKRVLFDTRKLLLKRCFRFNLRRLIKARLAMMSKQWKVAEGLLLDNGWGVQVETSWNLC